MGMDREVSGRLIKMAGPLTLSFLPSSPHLSEQVARAREAGHEIMAHVPMEPQRQEFDPGPNYLGIDQTNEQLLSRLDWNLRQIDGIVGVNNHMGSRFTSDPRLMKVILEELAKRDLLFLDSVTSSNSAGGRIARELGMPHVDRDIFIDNEVFRDNSLGSINQQLQELERVAKQKGAAVGIAHPFDATVDALLRWKPDAEARGFVFVPISAIVRAQLRNGGSAAAMASAPR